MTLPSLCSAIRSQLYFSQIVAWCDLLRKCDPSVYDSGRVIFASGNSSNAGDLAGHSGSTSGAAAAAAAAAARMRRPRLNIFYRIRPHDLSCSNANGNHNDGGFSAKANVHNFPHVNIAENFSVAVCVKSLPRFNGGLPHVSPSVSKPRVVRPVPAASTPTGDGGMCAATPTGLGARIAISTTPPASSCDKYGGRQQEAGDTDDLDGHREKQLQKYRKRMQRRDKKRERKPSEQLESMEPMDEGNEETQTQAMALTVLTAPRRIAMISTGTQTSLSSCQQCGSEKTLLCLNCEPGGSGHGNEAAEDDDDDDDADDTSASEMEDTSSCSLSSSDLIVGTPRSKAELLLQAIQRTPKNRKPMPKATAAARAGAGAACNDLKVGLVQGQSRNNQNNNQLKPAPSSGCQVCKRQKTQHNFANGKGGGPQQTELHSNGTNGHSKGGSGVDNDEDNSMEQELAVVSQTSSHSFACS